MASTSQATAPFEVEGPAEPVAVAIDQRRRLTIYASILLALLLATLDQTVVGTALPRIVTDLQGSDRYVWVVTAYLLSSTVTIPIYGKFSDVYGRKVMLLIAVGLFLAGSWLSGLSQTMDQLIAFRALQGLGAGGILPVAVATVGDLFNPRERGRYQGAFGALFGLSFLIGPFVGGWTTDHIGWHWIFYVNIPFALVTLAAVARLLPNRRLESARARDLDYPGIVLFTAGVLPLLIGLTNKGEIDIATGQPYLWNDARVLVPIVAGCVLLLLFVLAEARARQPIVPLDLFRDRNYALSMAVTFLVGLGAFVGIIFMPRFYQTVRGISATTAGYYLWPMVIGMMGSSIGVGLLISRTGRYKWVISGSTVLLMLGSFLMTGLQAGTSNWLIWSWLFLIGLGLGPTIAGFTVVVQSLVPLQRIGAASGTLALVRQIGTVIGLAVAGTVFSSIYQDRLPDSLAAQGLPPAVVSNLTRLSGALQGVGQGQALLHRVLPPGLVHLIPRIVAGANDAFSHATGMAFWVTLVAACAATVLTLLLRNSVLREQAVARSPRPRSAERP
jgi:EmrB/QacA subfamily drug resistance transporter